MSNQALREAIDHLFAEHNNKISPEQLHSYMGRHGEHDRYKYLPGLWHLCAAGVIDFDSKWNVIPGDGFGVD
jgi:hypothetical protein